MNNSKLDNLWNQMDKDNNGVLDKREANQFLQQVWTTMEVDESRRDEADFDHMFDVFDQDNSGYLDKKEFADLIRVLSNKYGLKMHMYKRYG